MDADPNEEMTMTTTTTTLTLQHLGTAATEADLELFEIHIRNILMDDDRCVDFETSIAGEALTLTVSGMTSEQVDALVSAAVESGW